MIKEVMFTEIIFADNLNAYKEFTHTTEKSQIIDFINKIPKKNPRIGDSEPSEVRSWQGEFPYYFRITSGAKRAQLQAARCGFDTC